MQITNQTNSYGALTKLLHWSVALGFLGLFGLGFWMVELDYYSSWYHQAPFIHKSVGVLLVLTMIFRFLWHLYSPTPQQFSNTPRWQFKWVRLLHLSFYMWILFLGVSGYLISTAEGDPIQVFSWFEVPSLLTPFDQQAEIAGSIHKWMAYGVMALVGLHALAAIWHHFFLKDNTLKKMLFSKRS